MIDAFIALIGAELSMQANVILPGQLAILAGGQDVVAVSGSNVGEALDDLVARYPDIRERLFAESGLKRFVNVYLGDEDIRLLDGLDTELEEGAEINIIPAIAGGMRRRDCSTW